MTNEHGHGPDEHDLGLRHDLPRLVGSAARPAARTAALLGRRRMLGLLAVAGLVAAGGCAAAATGASGGASTATGGAIPEETAGPYPGDGSNGPNVLTDSGVVRSDIRSGFGSLPGTAPGVPLTLDLVVVGAATGAALPGATVYLWHCDRDGAYSLYDLPNRNWLRGVQEADAAGRITFTSVFPGAYPGRWPHAHFEVFADLASATAGDAAVVTSQLALPRDACELVYATDGYASSVRHLARTSLDSDMVFRDGYASQLATVTGDVTAGMTAALTIRVG
jgi:protocatechuate 3,4-dioxygenase beta subunit